MENVLKSLKNIFSKHNLTVSVGESCTGGLISSYLTDIDGASDFVEQNFVTYAPKAKIKFLNVKEETIEKFGVVSKEVALEMAESLLQYADVSLSTTGYASTEGGDENNPPKTVYIGFGLKKNGRAIVKFIKYHSQKPIRVEIKKDFAKKALCTLNDFLKTGLN